MAEQVVSPITNGIRGISGNTKQVHKSYSKTLIIYNCIILYNINLIDYIKQENMEYTKYSSIRSAYCTVINQFMKIYENVIQEIQCCMKC